jgi:hypothetical protein
MKTKNHFYGVVSEAILCAALAFPGLAQGQVIFSCPFEGSGGDLLFRGFYIQSFPGVNLGTVQLRYSSSTPGDYTASMTARLGTYDGPIIGSTETINFHLTGSFSDQTMVTYDFGGAPVPSGSIVTFSQVLLSGSDSVFYDVGVGPCPGIVQTDGTSPPLDMFRRDSVGVTITQVPEPKSLFLLGIGFGGLAACLRWRKRPFSRIREQISEVDAETTPPNKSAANARERF